MLWQEITPLKWFKPKVVEEVVESRYLLKGMYYRYIKILLKYSMCLLLPISG